MTDYNSWNEEYWKKAQELIQWMDSILQRRLINNNAAESFIKESLDALIKRDGLTISAKDMEDMFNGKNLQIWLTNIANFCLKPECFGFDEFEQELKNRIIKTIIVEVGKKQDKQSDVIVAITYEKAELFHDQYQEAYARIKVDNHFEIRQVRSKFFKQWLANEFYLQKGTVPNSNSITSAILVIEGFANLQSKQITLYNRVAWIGNELWYDLSDENWRAVRITADGWFIVEEPPALFYRYAHMAAQVEPVQSDVSDLNQLWNFIPIHDDETRKLYLPEQLTKLVPDIPHTIPILHGPQGSTKSFSFRRMRDLIDPSVTPLLTLPKDKQEMVQQLNHHWYPVYDNAAILQDWQSDMLCRTSTGDGYSKRQLYTDSDDVIFAHKRCPGLNGINIPATKPDLLDRAILYEFEGIDESERRDEKELLADFNKIRPQLLGAMFTAVSIAIKKYPDIKIARKPRMADFAIWAEAFAQALGHEPETFLKIYRKNIGEVITEAIENNPVGAALLRFISNADIATPENLEKLETGEPYLVWEGSPTKLLNELTVTAGDAGIDTKDKSWPKAAHILKRRLKEIKRNLLDKGYRLVDGNDSEGNRLYRVWRGKNRKKALVASKLQEFEGIKDDKSLENSFDATVKNTNTTSASDAKCV